MQNLWVLELLETTISELIESVPLCIIFWVYDCLETKVLRLPLESSLLQYIQTRWGGWSLSCEVATVWSIHWTKNCLNTAVILLGRSLYLSYCQSTGQSELLVGYVIVKRYRPSKNPPNRTTWPTIRNIHRNNIYPIY